MKVVNAQQMRNLDRCAIEVFGIPSIVLMENAALAVVDVIREKYPTAERAAVFCGTGMNGGDGFAIARHLTNRGVTVQIFIIGDQTRITGDARTNLETCRHMQLAMWDVNDDDSLDVALAKSLNCDIAIDAIFGTGLSRAIEGTHKDLVDTLNALRLPIVAVDVPSGIDASTHRVIGPTVQADITVTFALPKVAHIFEPAADFCGETVVADISIPALAVAEENITLELITREDVVMHFQPRLAATHKGTYGHVAIHAGSEGRSGAAILAARGAVRSGSGLVTVLTDRETARLVDAVSIESMTLAFDRSDIALQQALEGKDALLIGPGLPDEEREHARTRELLAKVTLPTVLDAQAVNAFAGKIEELASLRMPRVLTPHPGELARLVGSTAAAVNDDRIAVARDAAQRTRSIVVLKGHQTLVATPQGEEAINTTGNPGMASGGVGDVLGGIIVSLLGRGIEPFDAARAAVFLHGRAGDRLVSTHGDAGLAATDLADMIPSAISSLRSE
jgi:NAD(P)H-hydrate epimerase